MPTLDIQIAQSSDCAHEEAGTVTIGDTGSVNELDALTDYVGTRYIVPDIANGDTINVAHLVVVPNASTNDEPFCTLYGQDADSPGTFTTAASNISGRTPTSALATWDVANLSATGTSTHNTPSLVAVLQEIIDRAGWAPGNAMVIIFQGGIAGVATATRDLIVKLFDNVGGPAVAPILHIEYTVGAGGGGGGSGGARRMRLGAG